MKIEGLPPRFWVVTEPTADSTIGDCCFECDFKRFAAQIRGGLDEQSIKGIFADQPHAVALAESLMGFGQEQVSTNPYTYYVATLSRYVLIQASNARAALEAGERHPELNGSVVLTVRIATQDEIEALNWHEQKLAEERRASK